MSVDVALSVSDVLFTPPLRQQTGWYLALCPVSFVADFSPWQLVTSSINSLPFLGVGRLEQWIGWLEPGLAFRFKRPPPRAKAVETRTGDVQGSRDHATTSQGSTTVYGANVACQGNFSFRIRESVRGGGGSPKGSHVERSERRDGVPAGDLALPSACISSDFFQGDLLHQFS